MANPKRRLSKSRRNKRAAANWKLKAPSLQPCPRCREPKPAHHVCLNCGYYKDQEVIAQQEA